MKDYMIIKKLRENVYDVCFSQVGWDDWARFERHKKYLRLIKGTPMPADLYKKAHELIREAE